MSNRIRLGSLTLTTTFVAIAILTATMGVWLPSSPVRADSLDGPRELVSGTSATYTLDIKCNEEPRLSVGKRSGSWVVDQSVATVVWTSRNPFPVVSLIAPEVPDDTVITLTIGCLDGSTNKKIVTAVTVPGPPQDTFADLVFTKDETAAMSSAEATGSTPCAGGTIASSSLIVLPGSGRWETEPVYSVKFNAQNSPVMLIDSIGRPIFDGVSDRETTVASSIVCESSAGRIVYRGQITVTNTTTATAPPATEPPIASDERGAISVAPARITEGDTVVISNTAASPCRNLVFPYGVSGLEQGDDGKFDFSISKGSKAGDLFQADASGNWAISIRFDDGFLAGQDVRRVTVTLACGTRENNRPSFDFIYQPAAFSVVAELPADPSTSITETTPAPSAPGASEVPAGQTVDAAGNQILPRAYLDGDTQQLIELATGVVIGEYDPISGQFVDPNTGEVTGIVDPATGELIDAATGIQIGISTTPPSASDGIALLGLGDDANTNDEASNSGDGSNSLAIVLAVVAGVLAVAVVALLVSRRKKPGLPPPPVT